LVQLEVIMVRLEAKTESNRENTAAIEKTWKVIQEWIEAKVYTAVSACLEAM
jgi:hypothetical protein